MLHVSRAFVVGFVSKKPEIAEVRGRGRVGRMRVMTSITQRRGGSPAEERKIEDLHRVVTFGPATAVVEQRVRKGTPVMIEGQLQYRFYEDRAGNERSVAEIVVGHQGMINVLEAPGGELRHAASTDD